MNSDDRAIFNQAVDDVVRRINENGIRVQQISSEFNSGAIEPAAAMSASEQLAAEQRDLRAELHRLARMNEFGDWGDVIGDTPAHG